MIRSGKIIFLNWSAVKAFFFSCLFIILLPLSAQAFQNIKFRRLSIEEGLPQVSVHSVVQDRSGFIWFGTELGLSRYDGKGFVNFLYNAQDSSSLSYNWVQKLYLDRAGILWVATLRGGLNRYIPETQNFLRFQADAENPASLSSDIVYCLLEDSSGRFWIGTGNGLNLFDREAGLFSLIGGKNFNSGSPLRSVRINDIIEDSQQRLWVATHEGLFRLNSRLKEEIHYHHAAENLPGLAVDRILSLHETRLEPGIIWIGTDGGGLIRLDSNSGTAKRFLNDPADPGSLSHNNIPVIFSDKYDALWIGTISGGLNRYDYESGSFSHFRHHPDVATSLSNDSVNSIFEDRTEVLWIGTDGGGISIYNRVGERFKLHKNDQANSNSLSNNLVRAVYEDRAGIIWIGTFGGGLNRYDPESGRYSHYRNDPDDSYSIYRDNVYSILEDREGILWIGTIEGTICRFDRERERFHHYHIDDNEAGDNRIQVMYEDSRGRFWVGSRAGGLYLFDRGTGKLTNFRYDSDDPESISSNFVYSMLEDSRGRFWVGTTGGANRFDPDSGRFVRYLHDSENPQSISNNFVCTVHEDLKGRFWVCTTDGLNQFDPDREIFRHFKIENGLPSNVIYGILEDDGGNLWLSTNFGLSRFNPGSGSFKNYDVSDGLQGNEFNGAAFFKSRSGEMFFGGTQGLNSFYPGNIKENPFPPQVVITDFQIAGRSVPIDPEAASSPFLAKSITYTDSIRLSHRDRFIAFEFASLHFVNPDKNRFQYILENFDPEWIDSENRNYASYTNLPPGEYKFRVKASNSDGIWDQDGTALSLVVAPPFWGTLWFKILAVLLLLGGIISFYRLKTNSIRTQNIRLEKKVGERTVALQGEIKERKKAEDQIKTSLLEKEFLLQEIHHRVKNNLQIISSLLRLQSSKIKDGEALEMFKESQNRINSMALIHEALYQSRDLANIDFSKYVHQLTGSIFGIFRNSAEGVRMKIEIKDVLMDVNKAIPCGLVLNELVTNALKHAFPVDSKGELRIQVEKGPDDLMILTVRDNGIGFPDGLDYRSTDSLGMRLINGLVSQIDGTIELNRGEGTEFVIKFKNTPRNLGGS